MTTTSSPSDHETTDTQPAPAEEPCTDERRPIPVLHPNYGLPPRNSEAELALLRTWDREPYRFLLVWLLAGENLVDAGADLSSLECLRELAAAGLVSLEEGPIELDLLDEQGRPTGELAQRHLAMATDKGHAFGLRLATGRELLRLMTVFTAAMDKNCCWNGVEPTFFAVELFWRHGEKGGVSQACEWIVDRQVPELELLERWPGDLKACYAEAVNQQLKGTGNRTDRS